MDRASNIGIVLVILAALLGAAWGITAASTENETHMVFGAPPAANPDEIPKATPPQGPGTATASPTPCTGWRVVTSPNVGAFLTHLWGAAAVSANDVWAVGFYVDQVNRQQTLTEHWDGTQWIIVPSPNVGTSHNVLHKAVALAANDIWAVGFSYDTPLAGPRR